MTRLLPVLASGLVLLAACASGPAPRPDTTPASYTCEPAGLEAAITTGCCGRALIRACSLPAPLATLLEALAEPLPDRRYQALLAGWPAAEPLVAEACPTAPPKLLEDLAPRTPRARVNQLFAVCPGVETFTTPQEAGRADVQGLLVGAVVHGWMQRHQLPRADEVARQLARLGPRTPES